VYFELKTIVENQRWSD